MNILIIGSGGREHALAWKISQSSLVDKIYCAPGNGGIKQIAECVDFSDLSFEDMANWAKDKNIGLTVVGPEVSLVDGIVDIFEEQGLKIFGPSKNAAQLEGSKAFSKEFMYEHNIPTAPFINFENKDDAIAFLQNDAEYPVVVKADGLAAGKGVIICEDKEQAIDAVEKIMGDQIFKEAGNKIVIEECLEGEEASILVVSDGINYKILASSQDHKRIFDDDLGPNTGGMGAYSPAPIVTDELLQEVDEEIVGPTIEGMRLKDSPFKGVLYVGIMVTDEGPMVLEYNVRFGDPEAQVVLARMKNDLVQIMLDCCEGNLYKDKLVWDSKACVCVVMSSGGYPGAYEKGYEITGLENVNKYEDMVVFHAGTKEEQGKILTNGGRVLGITGLGNDIESAIERTYKLVDEIKFDRCFFRRDIGGKALRLTK